MRRVLKHCINIFFTIYLLLGVQGISQDDFTPYDRSTQDWIFGNGPEPKWVLELLQGAHNIPEDTKFVLNIPVSGSAVNYQAFIDSNATIEMDGDYLIITPDQDFNGSILLTLNLDLSFILNVEPVNDKPILSETPTQKIDEDTELSLNLFALDIDEELLTFGATIDGNGLISVVNDEITITPDKDFNGIINVVTAVSDGTDTDESEFILHVSPVNDTPILHPIEPQSIAEDTSLRLKLSAVDVDGDELTYTASADGNAKVDIQEDQLLVVPDADFNGTILMTVNVSDGFANDKKIFSLNVLPVKDDPVLSSVGPQSIAEDTSLRLKLSAVDADGDELTYSASSNKHAKVSIHENQLLVVPDANFNGEIFITVNVSDGSSNDELKFKLDVTPINDAPVLTSIKPRPAENKKHLNLMLSANDVDGDGLTYSANIHGDAKVEVNDNKLTVKPGETYKGAVPITLSTFDGSTTVDTNVTLINPFPGIIAIAPQSIAEDSDLTLMLYASDVEGDLFKFSSTVNNNAKVSIVENRLMVIPMKDYFGPLTVIITVSDGTDSTEFNFNIDVLPVRDPPIANAGEDIILSNGCNRTVLLDGMKSWDADNDPLTFQWDLLDTLNTVSYDIAKVDFTFPDTTIDISMAFLLTVKDITGLVGKDTLLVTIINDEPPTANAGEDFIAPYNEKVYLDGSRSVDTDSKIQYEWSIIDDGITIPDIERVKEKPYFIFPKGLPEDKMFRIQLSTKDENTFCEDLDTVSVMCLRNVGLADSIKFELVNAIQKGDKIFIEMQVTNQRSWPFDFAAFTLIRVTDEKNNFGKFDPYKGKNTVKYGIENGETINVDLVYSFKTPPINIHLSCKSNMRLRADSVFYSFNF